MLTPPVGAEAAQIARARKLTGSVVSVEIICIVKTDYWTAQNQLRKETPNR